MSASKDKGKEREGAPSVSRNSKANAPSKGVTRRGRRSRGETHPIVLTSELFMNFEGRLTSMNCKRVV